jgi:hypothetical protein
MIKIKSIAAGFPAQEATGIEISLITFKTDTLSVMTYWQLYNDSGISLSSGNYELTENQYKSWGADNKFVENCVISFLGIERL